MTLTHTQHTMLTWLERHGPAPLSHIARAFGITTDTAGVHMNIISRAGQAHATGRDANRVGRLGRGRSCARLTATPSCSARAFGCMRSA